MWKEDRQFVASQNVAMHNRYFDTLISCFTMHANMHISLEQARNTVRNLLSEQNLDAFPMGPNGVDMKDLLNAMFEYSPESVLGHETTLCDDCGMHNPTSMPINTNILVFSAGTWRITNMHNFPQSPVHGSTEQCALLYFKSLRIHTPCPECRTNLRVQKSFNTLPKLLVIHLGQQLMHISHEIKIQMPSGECTYRLKGLIHFGDFHFTSQFVDKNNNLWYHDGIQTGQRCILEGSLNSSNNDTLLMTHNKQVCTAVYAMTYQDHN